MNVRAFSDRLQDAAIRDGFGISWYGKVGEIGLPVLERKRADNAPSVYLSAGVHGNEPAGPIAVLDLLRRKAFPASLNLTIFPLINPDGLAARTRENAGGIDLNRDYGSEPQSYETSAQLKWIGDRTFDLILCLHEDDDGEGFYIYEHLEAPTVHDYAGRALEAARPWTGIDSREVIDEMPARNGRMMPPEDVIDRTRQDLPEALRLFFYHGAKYTFTTETPSRQPIDKRIRAQCAVVEVILATFAAGQQR